MYQEMLERAQHRTEQTGEYRQIVYTFPRPNENSNCLGGTYDVATPDDMRLGCFDEWEVVSTVDPYNRLGFGPGNP